MFKLVTFLPHDNDPLYIPLTHNKLHPNKVKNEGKTIISLESTTSDNSTTTVTIATAC